MKHNKTPGIDGFPSEFFKILGGKLKVFVLLWSRASAVAITGCL